MYGALLNEAFKFGDQRMGASVTASGRHITEFMLMTGGKLLNDKQHWLEKRYADEAIESSDQTMDVWNSLPLTKQSPDHMALYKIVEIDEDGGRQFSSAVRYSDTDSGYFSLGIEGSIEELRETAVSIADEIANKINNEFPKHMKDRFLCQDGFDNLIKAGREIVASKAIFQAKKKYICRVVDKEGKTVDEIKSQGSEIKKSDTPKVIRVFLKNTIDAILKGYSWDSIADFVNTQRKKILNDPTIIFDLGVSKQVNNLEVFSAEYARLEKTGIGKAKLPGHVRAAINYNNIIAQYDKGAKMIKSGDKILIYYLHKNDHGFKAIGIPAELSKFPFWFDELFSVDRKTTESKMIDNKLKGVFTAYGKPIPDPHQVILKKFVKF